MDCHLVTQTLYIIDYVHACSVDAVIRATAALPEHSGHACHVCTLAH